MLIGLFLVFFVLLGLDIVSKLWAYSQLTTPVVFTKFLQFRFVLNKGLALSVFSSFGKNNQSILSLVILSALVMFCCYFFTRYRHSISMIFASLLVLAGGLGNLWSRFFYGGVIDFLEVSFFGINSSVFNLADIYIGMGLFFILLRVINESS